MVKAALLTALNNTQLQRCFPCASPKFSARLPPAARTTRPNGRRLSTSATPRPVVQFCVLDPHDACHFSFWSFLFINSSGIRSVELYPNSFHTWSSPYLAITCSVASFVEIGLASMELHFHSLHSSGQLQCCSARCD